MYSSIKRMSYLWRSRPKRFYLYIHDLLNTESQQLMTNGFFSFIQMQPEAKQMFSFGCSWWTSQNDVIVIATGYSGGNYVVSGKLYAIESALFAVYCVYTHMSSSHFFGSTRESVRFNIKSILSYVENKAWILRISTRIFVHAPINIQLKHQSFYLA